MFSRNVNSFDQTNIDYPFHTELPLHVDCYITGYGTLSISLRISKDLSMNSIDHEVTLEYFDRKKERVWHVSLITRSGSVHTLSDKLIVRGYINRFN